MNGKWIAWAAVLVLLIAATLFNMHCGEPRMSKEQMREALDAREKLDAAHQDAEKAQQKTDEPAAGTQEAAGQQPAANVEPSHQAAGNQKEHAVAEQWPEEMPEVWRVLWDCSMGEFVIEVHKDWAPIGAQRFFDLCKSGFYDQARFFRVVKEPRPFMAQAGIAADPNVQAQWRDKTIKDDPVKQSNTPGMVTFAKTGAPNSRSTQVFINFSDNSFLDNQGFAPFGKVVEGMDTVMNINGEYGEQPQQQMIQMQGNDYLIPAFPRLDYIEETKLLEGE